ncbi:hypothetical protein SK128_016974 [Halocaridina rubra]|uniref:Sarcosine dehydrogenase n=1 Tax=Halocaridina rubra TaxID=373956 RepID=A0AAN9AEQ0_HALRR
MISQTSALLHFWRTENPISKLFRTVLLTSSRSQTQHMKWTPRRKLTTGVELPSSVDVVVIGGGVMGCFTLYHLARLGCSSLLLERHKLTSGTTWHTNGLLWRIRPGEIDTALLNATRNTILQLEEDGPAGWTGNGGLFIASNKLRLEEYARLYTIGQASGVECQLLSPHEVKDLYPLMNVEDVVGALHSPGDGVLDPSMLCYKLTQDAQKMGAKICEGVEVTGLEIEENQFGGHKVKKAITNFGSISTQAVVNCTGEDWDIRGLFHGCGFNSSGMMLSGGCSEQLAHWIVYGRSSIDMAAYDCRRFPKSAQGWRTWCKERSHEAYTSNYAIVFPNNQPLASRSMITDPLFETLTNSGCFWEESFGWERPAFFTANTPAPLLPYDWNGAFGNERHENYLYRDILKQGHTFDMPSYYEQIKDEYLAIREKAAIINQSSVGKISLSGRDAEGAIDWLFMDNINRNRRTISSSLVLNDKGGIEANVTVFTLDDNSKFEYEGKSSYLLQCDSGKEPYIRRLLRDVCQDKNLSINLHSLTNSLSSLLLLGPVSHNILQYIGIDALNVLKNTFSTFELKNTTVRLSRHSNETWEFHVARENLLNIYNYLMECGAEYGLRNAGYRALSIFQLENGVPTCHKDIRGDDTPLEAGLMTIESLTYNPRNFSGKRALLNQATHGINKIRIILESKCPFICGNEGIIRDGKLVGLTRKADHSFERDASIAVGYANIQNTSFENAKLSLQKSNWEIERMGKRYPARIYESP